MGGAQGRQACREVIPPSRSSDSFCVLAERAELFGSHGARETFELMQNRRCSLAALRDMRRQPIDQIGAACNGFIDQALQCLGLPGKERLQMLDVENFFVYEVPS